ncbi:MAG TPA: tetratricopeptide repeat protein [Gammaproteobacteria bacterium]|nr:tetratricopeptide repeat protein [Gammaproteobacteria bacterium]
MTPSIKRLKTCGVAAVASLLLAAVPAAYAQRAGEKDKDEAPQQGFDVVTGKTINEAIELLNMDNYQGAQAKLGTLKMDKLSPYERGRVEQVFFQIAIQQDKYDEARQHLLNAINSGGLSEDEVSKLRYQIAVLYIQEENWAKGAQALEDWFKTAQNPNGAAYYLLAIAYYSQDKHDKAFEPAKKAVELTDQPQSGWIQLLAFLYIEREDFKSAVPLMERLISMEPKKKDNWVQLSNIYQQMDDYPKALAAMQVAYEADMLNQDSEYRRLADMLLFNEIPYRCAELLDKAIDDKKIKADEQAYEKLANCWISAREFDKALDPLERAAQLSPNGDLYVRLAEVNVQRQDWGSAASAVQKGIEKGKLKDAAYAQLLMGIALYEEKKPQDAIPYFQRAAKSDARRKSAQNYLQRIEYEAQQKRQAQGG